MPTRFPEVIFYQPVYSRVDRIRKLSSGIVNKNKIIDNLFQMLRAQHETHEEEKERLLNNFFGWKQPNHTEGGDRD